MGERLSVIASPKLSNHLFVLLSVCCATLLVASPDPPGNLKPGDVPQFVCVTFDDNFGLADPKASGGIDFITEFFQQKKNPAGTGNPLNFDGQPIHTAFYFTSIYVVDESGKVLGGKPGEDHMGRNRKAWMTAIQSGHEAGVHTVNHFNGGVVPLTDEDWGRPRNWNAEEWTAEIKSCKDTLTGKDGISAKPEKVVGFRAPFLGYNDEMLTALRSLNFRYDSSLPNCFADSEDGTNCSWPYSLEKGSSDMEVVAKKFSDPKSMIFPEVTKHSGLWEIPPTTLIIPPDSLAQKYQFAAGLRSRITAKGKMPYPSLYEPSTGKIAGLDYTLLMDAGLSGAEMSAVLKYNLDLHVSGNRAPIVFIAHSHLYAFSSPENNPDTPTMEQRDERWKGLTDFLNYALTKSNTRIVSPAELLDWIERASSQPR